MLLQKTLLVGIGLFIGNNHIGAHYVSEKLAKQSPLEARQSRRENRIWPNGLYFNEPKARALNLFSGLLLAIGSDLGLYRSGGRADSALVPRPVSSKAHSHIGLRVPVASMNVNSSASFEPRESQIQAQSLQFEGPQGGNGASDQTALDFAREELLKVLRPLRMGFRSTKEQRRDANAYLETFLKQFGSYPEAEIGHLDGRWQLMYSDAPDILGIRGGPLSELVFIGQEIDEVKGTCDNIIRYRPSDQAQTLFQAIGQNISDDRLEQRVLLSFEKNPSKEYPNRIKQALLGTKVIPLRLLGGRISNTWAPDLGGTGFFGVPFGSYDVLYNDNRVRIVRTQQGFISVNERILVEEPVDKEGIFMPSAEAVAGKTILITGGNSGLGLESAKRLARAGANIVLTVRSHDKITSTLNEVKHVAPEANVSVLLLDLASLESIRAFPAEYDSSVGAPLDVLIANAGVMAIPERRTTMDGFERQIGVNHLGHFALVSAMLPSLKQATKGFRIICVSSEGHRLTNEVDMNLALDSNLDPSDYTPWGNYGISKAANVLFTKELQDRFDAAGLPASAMSLHPGVVNTDLGRYLYQGVESAESGKPQNLEEANPLQKAVQQGLSIFTLSPKKGANTQIFLAAAADSDGNLSMGGGKYFDDMKEASPKAFTSNKDLASKLWELSEKLTGTNMSI